MTSDGKVLIVGCLVAAVVAAAVVVVVVTSSAYYPCMVSSSIDGRRSLIVENRDVTYGGVDQTSFRLWISLTSMVKRVQSMDVYTRQWNAIHALRLFGKDNLNPRANSRTVACIGVFLIPRSEEIL